MSKNEKTGLNNSTYNILSALGRDADFLYDTIDKYIRDAESANKSDLVELWKTIKNDRHKHIYRYVKRGFRKGNPLINSIFKNNS